MNKTNKAKLIEEYKEIFNHAATGILISTQGLTVEDTVSLRQTLRESNSRMKMLKNRVARKAAEGTAFEELSQSFKEMRALIYNDEDVVTPAKIIVKEVEKTAHISLVAGLLVTGGNSEVLNETEVVALSKTPSKEELLAKLLFLFNAPITNFARTLNEIPTGLARVLQAVADSKN